MKKLALVCLVALLLAGCGGEDGDSSDSAVNPTVQPPVPIVENWAEWEANPEPYGGLNGLAKIREAKESGATKLSLRSLKIRDLSPLAGLTKL